MATILPFVIPPRTGPAARCECSAEIVIFPGVRYEMAQDGSEPRKSSGTARKRKSAKSR